jgi:plastocyanin
MRKTIVSLTIVAGALVLAGCSLYGNAPASNNAANQMPATGAPSPAAVSGNAINIQNFAFNPGTLMVTKGTTVTWTNNDSAPHQIKSATFNSSQLSKGQTFSFTFNDAGTFDYSCAIHPSMLGKIIVQ